MKARGFALFAIYILCSFLLTAAAHSESRRKLEVERVEIKGNKAISSGKIESLMLTRGPGLFSKKHFYPDVLKGDINNIISYYNHEGYLDAQLTDSVAVDSSSMTVNITIDVSEGPLTRIENLAILGNTVFPDSLLLRKIKLKQGDPFKRNVINEGMLGIAALYADSGYLDASVKPVTEINNQLHTASVDFMITENQQFTIDSIIINGLVKTNKKVVTRELRFKPGQIVRYSRLLDSQGKLYLTGLFESVFIRAQPAGNGNPDQKDIVIDIKEKLSSEFSAKIGYGSVEKIRGNLELVTTNLSGMGRQAGVNGHANFIEQGVEGSFTEPWTLGTKLKTDLNLYLDYQQEPGYHLRKYGGLLTVGKSFGRHTTASLSYRHEDVKLKVVDIAELPDTLASNVRSLILSTIYDSRDNLFNPTRGNYREWTNEVAGTFLNGNNSFTRSIVRLKLFVPWRQKTVVGSAVEVGWMDVFDKSRRVPLNERFYAGGPNTLRGFGYQKVGPKDKNGVPLGGKFMIVWNVFEIRKALYKIIKGAVFMDSGNVWSEIRDFKPGDFRTDAGPGLRADTPVGVLRLDLGINMFPKNNEEKYQLYFGVGQAF